MIMTKPRKTLSFYDSVDNFFEKAKVRFKKSKKGLEQELLTLKYHQ